MVLGKCNNPNCTVATTGTCLESHANVKECPNYIEVVDQIIEGVDALPISLSDLDPASNSSISTQFSRVFHSGNELGTHDVIPIMQRRYTHLVGILGSTNVGKTCLLASFYLLASQGELLPEYYFGGSLTLQGFEERVRGLRTWEEGGLPEQLVEHTHLQDPRRPAFLHLCIKENISNGKWVDLLFTDLPGEWTDDMINHQSAASRLDFLKRADGIIYVIDGPLLNKAEDQYNEVYKTKIAIDRLVENVLSDLNVPIVFAISKCDEIDMQYPKAIQEITQHTKKYGLSTAVVLTASFSRTPDKVSSGIGVINAIKSALNPVQFLGNQSDGWIPSERSFWSFSAR
jgi:hypothetical protein